MAGRPDPKPTRRVRDPLASRRKRWASPGCRMCSSRSTAAHHIIRRRDGDDVEDNLVPLCGECHTRYHDGELFLMLTRSETHYVVDKLGLERAWHFFGQKRLVPDW